MAASPAADPYLQEINALKDAIITAVGGEALAGGDLTLKRAGLGGVAHDEGLPAAGRPDHGDPPGLLDRLAQRALDVVTTEARGQHEAESSGLRRGDR